MQYADNVEAFFTTNGIDICYKYGARSGVVVKKLRYKPAGRGFDSLMVSLEFFSDIILPVAPWP
jgi:hypothetical protein